MADHDCVAYSNNVEIFFAQQGPAAKQLSHKHCGLHYYSYYTTIVDIQTKVQDPAL